MIFRGGRVLSRAHEGNRVLVDAVSFFRTDAEIADRFAFALQNGRRLRVCLEGAEGTGKGDIIWRLGAQGYAVSRVPFVPWMSQHRKDDENWGSVDELRKWSLEWQKQWMQACLAADTGRPGLCFAARSPLTSALELMRRGTSDVELPKIPEDFVVVQLETENIQLQRRVAEKTFNEPESRESKMRLALRCSAPLPKEFRSHASINSTSSKQGTAALLKLVGVQAPTFPPAFSKK